MNLDFYRKWCNDAYKVDKDVFPKTEVTEAYWGGLNINVDHLIMTNGEEDPWKRASILKNNGKNSKITLIEIPCENCAHCVDLHAPSANDAPALTAARNNILNLFKGWINDHWSK